MTDDPHAGIQFECGAEIEVEDEQTGEDEAIARCTKMLTWEENGRYVKNPPRDVGFDMGGLRFDCPSCGNVAWRCPNCTDSDDNQPPGWYRGDSTNEVLACANCRPKEAERQRRDPHWPP